MYDLALKTMTNIFPGAEGIQEEGRRKELIYLSSWK
jgi:hypothetical protein